MEIISIVALLLLALIRYAGGSALGGRGRIVVPGLLDLIAIVTIWTLTLVSCNALGKWLAIAIWLPMGLGRWRAILASSPEFNQKQVQQSEKPSARLAQFFKEQNIDAILITRTLRAQAN